MTAAISLLLLASVAQVSTSQPDCPALLAGLRQKIVANYAGHLLEVKGERAADYRSLVSELGRDAVDADREACRVVLERLIDWYEDPHLFLFQSTRLDSAETARRVTTLEYRPVDELEAVTAIAARSNVDPIEGIWYDGARRMAVIPGESAGSFLAVVTASDTITLPVGAVAARITATGPGEYRVRLLAASLAERVTTATMHREGTLLRLSPGMWGKAVPLPSSAVRMLDPHDVHRPVIRVLDDVVIVSVPSHDPRLRGVLDSLVGANAAALGSDKPLLVDLRGNEGGGSQTTASLMPFLMDSTPRPRTYQFGRAMMLSSPDQMRYVKRAFGPDTSSFVRRLVAEMEAHPAELVPISGPEEPPAPGAEVVPIYGPRKVAVLIDRGTVSASEVTVRETQRSDRAVVMGQPTAGALDYQSTYIVAFAEGEGQWYLGYPTITAHPSLPEGGIRGIGIAPDVWVDWSEVEDPYAAAVELLDRPVPIGFSDLDTLAYASDLAISPDGIALAFQERSQILVMPTDGSGVARPVGPGMRPVWSPDGREFAIIAPADGDLGFQLFRVRTADGVRTRVTELPGGVVPDRIDWSSRDELVFTANVAAERQASGDDREIPKPASAELGFPLILHQRSPDGYALNGLVTGFAPRVSRLPPAVPELFVHSLATGVTRQLTSDAVGYHDPAWSPDGTLIVAGSRRGTGDNRMQSGLWLVDAATGSAVVLVPEGETAKSTPRWSPNGGEVAYQFHSFTAAAEHGIGVVAVCADGEVGEPRVAYRGLVNTLEWVDDGTGLYTAAIVGVTRPVSRIDLASGRAVIVGSREHVVSGSIVAAAGVVAWVESNGSRPSVIMVGRGAAASAIHDANRWLASRALGEQESVNWRSRHGHLRSGVLIKPVGFRPGTRYPLVVSAYTQTTHLNGFQGVTHGGFASQAYAAKGYMVFFPGPRLPWTYGSLATSADEAEQIRGAKGWDIAVDDVESGVDALIARGLVDSTRMAIMGFSNGGAVATAVLTRTDRYRAVVAVAPANINWVQNALFEDDRDQRWIPPTTFTGIGKELWEDPDQWVAGSPVFHLGSATSPVLLAVGDRDSPSFTLPTVELYLGLRRLGRDVTLLRYPGIGHGFYGPAGNDLARRVLAFVEERLGELEDIVDAH